MNAPEDFLSYHWSVVSWDGTTLQLSNQKKAGHFVAHIHHNGLYTFGLTIERTNVIASAGHQMYSFRLSQWGRGTTRWEFQPSSHQRNISYEEIAAAAYEAVGPQDAVE
jgi:hypothetical protein